MGRVVVEMSAGTVLRCCYAGGVRAATRPSWKSQSSTWGRWLIRLTAAPPHGQSWGPVRQTLQGAPPA